MKKLKIVDLITIDEFSVTPKFLQISNSILREIQYGSFELGESLPSINELSIIIDVSRDTVERGYKHLKNIGILDSVPRRGYFVKSVDIKNSLKIFLLFNKLSEHKKKIYDAFFQTIGDHSIIDFYIYNNDFNLFKYLLTNRRIDYTNYVIIPHFLEGSEIAYQLIDSLPKDKLLLLDKKINSVSGQFASAYENFETDIYQALTKAKERLSKYHTIKIIFPENSYYPSEIIQGFTRFCRQHEYKFKVVDNILIESINSGEAYIVVMEEDLVKLIQKVQAGNLMVGEQVGVISYNEIPLKQVILNGITTISSDFCAMGRIAAELILSKSRSQVEVPFNLIMRPSL